MEGHGWLWSGKRRSEMTAAKSKASVKNTTKAAGVTGAAGVILPYVAYRASLKWNVPVEVSLAAASTVFAYIGRWAAKLNPDG